MNLKSKAYIQKLRNLYGQFEDKESLAALDEAEILDFSIQEKKRYAQIPMTQSLLTSALRRYKNEIIALTTKRDMPDEERRARFVSLDWAMWYIDSVGGDPKEASSQVDAIILDYARKAGISTD